MCNLILPTLDLFIYEYSNDSLEIIQLTLHLILDRKFGASQSLGNARRQYFSFFSTGVNQTLREKNFQRREYPPNRQQPERNLNRIRPIADKIVSKTKDMSVEDALIFLGLVTGAWVLSCPIDIIRKDYIETHRGIYGWVESESFVLSIMIDWLTMMLDETYT